MLRTLSIWNPDRSRSAHPALTIATMASIAVLVACSAQDDAAPAGTATRGGACADRRSARQLERLGQLRDKGLLSDEEFEVKKTELLGRL
jgi:hypothetical protein